MELLDMLDISRRLAHWADTLSSLIPFFMFVVAIILGNLGDKKKPKVKKSKPFPKDAPLPDLKRPEKVTVDIKPIPQPPVRREKAAGQAAEQLPEHRPHRPDQYEEVHNPYQRYLEDESRRSTAAKAEGRQGEAGNRKRRGEKPAEAAYGEEKARSMPVINMSLAQAIVSAEVLGRPKALQRRRR
ncbi:MAG: hypothetical protein ACI3U2_00565 [Anaerovibrio sp.]